MVGALVDGHELLREGRQHLRTVLSDDDEILDPDAAETLQVNARLDRDDVAGDELVRGFRAEARGLVDVETDAVAEPVAEGLAETSLFDHPTGRGVGVDAAHSG